MLKSSKFLENLPIRSKTVIYEWKERRRGEEEVKEEKEQEVQEQDSDFHNLEVCERADRVLRSKASSL